MFIQKFLDWLNEGSKANGADKKTPIRPLLAAPKTPLQIAQRSLPSPERLSEMADEYDAKQLQASNEKYEAFMKTGYPNFVQWLESLIEKSATFGGRVLLLTFDNATGIVTATTPEPREILPPNSFALPISQSTLQKLAASIADHFQKANFLVRISRQESTCSRTGSQYTPAYDYLDILWAQTPQSLSPKPAKRRPTKATRTRKPAPRKHRILAHQRP